MTMTKHLGGWHTMTIDEIAHKVATCAVDEKDNVGMYTVVKNKVLELLHTREDQ